MVVGPTKEARREAMLFYLRTYLLELADDQVYQHCLQGVCDWEVVLVQWKAGYHRKFQAWKAAKSLCKIGELFVWWEGFIGLDQVYGSCSSYVKELDQVYGYGSNNVKELVYMYGSNLVKYLYNVYGYGDNNVKKLDYGYPGWRESRLLDIYKNTSNLQIVEEVPHMPIPEQVAKDTQKALDLLNGEDSLQGMKAHFT